MLIPTDVIQWLLQVLLKNTFLMQRTPYNTCILTDVIMIYVHIFKIILNDYIFKDGL